MRTDWTLFRTLGLPLQLLLFTQFAFNVGFYLVVPFLAAYLEDDLLLGGGLVGLVLGLRTFSQQGLFFLGGAIADRWGVKPVVLVGVVIRILGFLALAVSRDLGVVIGGVVLIGLAAALFSPASESAIVALAGAAEADGGPRRTRVLALQNVFSQAGSAVGPALGGMLMFVPFRATCVVAAAVFLLIGLMHARWLPAGLRTGEGEPVTRALAEAVTNRRFLAFAAVNCVILVGYNQMYLALPVELTRIGLPSASITWFFLLASVLVVAAQSWVTRQVDRLATPTVFRLGYAVTALAFCCVGAVAWLPPGLDVWRVLPAAGFVVLLHLGSMVVAPPTRDLVGRLARERNLGAHLGLMATAGGIAVLVTGPVVGTLLEAARTPGPAAVVPWFVLAALPALAALAVGHLVANTARSHPAQAQEVIRGAVTARPGGMGRPAASA